MSLGSTISDLAMVVVPCRDLDQTVNFFVDELGFRVEMITPADNPNTTVISGHGIRLCLQLGDGGQEVKLQVQSANRPEKLLIAPNGTQVEIVSTNLAVWVPAVQQSLVISHLVDETSSSVGRAGMRYRDLVPNRLGGSFIVSHIHIPIGGPVPDYVHYHDVRFQMIYCKSGWVRVVYEDQGDAFVMNAGDCVLQPPGIRHRVLESSDNLEVIEIACPAEHNTYVEHEITLPTAVFRPDRNFGGQLFAHHVASNTDWQPWIHDDFEIRDTTIATATNGQLSASCVRGNTGAGFIASSHSYDFYFLFIIKGSARFLALADQIETNLIAGSSIAVPSDYGFELKVVTENTEMLMITGQI